MSQRNQDRLPRRERRAKERMAAKEVQRQSKITEERNPQSKVSAGFMEMVTRQFQQNALPLSAFLAAIFIFYFPALSGEFVWDDSIFAKEKTIHAWSGLWSIWFAPSEIMNEGHYWPITYTTFWLEHKLFGLNPLGYHIVNCILYFINIVLIWRLLLRLEVPGAWAISMIFAVHPLHVESVAWLIERKSLLSALFYLGAVHVWLRFRESPRLKTYALALSLYVLALLSKSIAVTLPATLLVLLWWKQERVTAHDIMRLLPFFIVGFVITLGDYLFYASREEQLSFAYSFVERALIAAQALWFYVGKLLWPADLMVIYPHWDVSAKNPIAWLFVVAIVGMLILLWSCRHRIGKGTLAGIAFFVITLSPAFGFVDHKYMAFSFVADRYQYLAGLGLIAVLVGGAVRAMQPYITTVRPAVMGAFAILVIGLGTLTWSQAAIYQNGITFFNHVVAHNPTARAAYHNLSSELFQAGRTEEAYEANLKAIELRPNNSAAHSNFATVLILMKRYDEAMESLKRALELNPHNEAAWQNYGSLLLKQQRYEEAYAANLKAIELRPNNSKTHYGLATALTLLKRYDEAEESLKRTLELNPKNEAAWLSYGNLHLEQQRYEEAVAAFRETINLNEDSVLAHGGIADSYYRLGNHSKAMEWIGRAQALTPTPTDQDELSKLSAKVLLALGKTQEAEQHLLRSSQDGESEDEVWRLLKLHKISIERGDIDRADSYLQRILKLAKDSPKALQSAADTLREQQQYAEAIEIYKQILAIDLNFAMAYAGMGDALFRLEHYEEAIKSLKRSVELHSSPSSTIVPLLLMGQAAGKLGRVADATQYYERTIELDPQNASALEHLVGIRFGEKRYEDALRLIASLRDIRPNDAWLYYNMGITLNHLDRYEEAIRSFETALSLDPSMEDARSLLEQLKKKTEERK